MHIKMRWRTQNPIPQDATTLGMGFGSTQLEVWCGPYLGHRGWDTKHEAIGPCGGASAQVV